MIFYVNIRFVSIFSVKYIYIIKQEIKQLNIFKK